jgi:5-(carboxyamino)imidazole ribonucleotide mutase
MNQYTLYNNTQYFYTIVQLCIFVQNLSTMKPLVSIIMGSTSDWPVMQKAAKFLNDMEIPFEVNALSAHRTPEKVEAYASKAYENGVKVIIAGAGGAAHLPGVMAAFTPLPIIGVPCRSSISIDGWDSILSILQMPPGIPVATVGLDASLNAAILATQMIGIGDEGIMKRVIAYKESLKDKIIKANEDLGEYKFDFRVS